MVNYMRTIIVETKYSPDSMIHFLQLETLTVILALYV